MDKCPNVFPPDLCISFRDTYYIPCIKSGPRVIVDGRVGSGVEFNIGVQLGSQTEQHFCSYFCNIDHLTISSCC